MTDKYHSDTQEKIETLTYFPGLQGTGDLEPATKTITATSKQATADYSKSLTLIKPSDARIIVKRIAAKLKVTRDSGTSTALYCTVSIDSADGSTNLLFNAVNVQANAEVGTSLTSGAIFGLLSDGGAHTFYFFFWVDSGDSVISLVALWEGVGQYGATGRYHSLWLNHTGLCQITLRLLASDGDSAQMRVNIINGLNEGNLVYSESIGGSISGLGSYGFVNTGLVLIKDATIAIAPTVATYLIAYNKLTIQVRSEQ